MGLKHRLKSVLRDVYARVVWYTGLHRLVDRMLPPRLTILYGHCVDQPATNAALDADMKITAERLERILRRLGRRYDLVSVGEGVDRLDADANRSMVALSMDDGYRDNLHDLVPLLERVGGRATVFLEGGAVALRELPWLHALGWLVGRLGASAVAERLGAALPGLSGIDDANRLKRALKYDADPEARDAALEGLVASEGGDARAIVDELYLAPDEARALYERDVVEVGGHTLHHPVLARLDASGQGDEIEGGARALRGLLDEPPPPDDGAPAGSSGRVFAYPYGRRWDFDDESVAAARAAGYACAVTTHAGVNGSGTDRYRLHRWPIHDGTALHHVGAEASGCFELLRRIGIDLVE